MCFELDSRPPVAPIAGAAVTHEHLVLESGDGTRFAELGHIAGAVGFYGNPGERNGQPGPAQRAGEITAPRLALMAGEDHAIGPEAVEAFGAALTAAGAEHEIVTYPGAPHSFFDRKQEQFAAESQDAWERTLASVAAHG